mmetsp:Transcript_8237/g.25462  ORF Transcript_8237/g.25462 Transcript_8237/m.25462 type:complete len:213 (-) Transcript_8237:107-745(-)
MRQASPRTSKASRNAGSTGSCLAANSSTAPRWSRKARKPTSRIKSFGQVTPLAKTMEASLQSSASRKSPSTKRSLGSPADCANRARPLLTYLLARSRADRATRGCSSQPTQQRNGCRAWAAMTASPRPEPRSTKRRKMSTSDAARRQTRSRRAAKLSTWTLPSINWVPTSFPLSVGGSFGSIWPRRRAIATSKSGPALVSEATVAAWPSQKM